MRSVHDDADIIDLLGIGFGPSNLALAIALRESIEVHESGLRFAFVEKQAQFGWHTSLLLPDAQLQISPLKDLVTMRDPTSSFSFINYLFQKGRLTAYINRGGSIPSRHEWTAYLIWAAQRMEDVITYNQSVERIEAEKATNGGVQLLKVSTRNNDTGEITIRFARNVVVGVGGVLSIPRPFLDLYNDKHEQGVSPIVHSSSFLPHLHALEPSLRHRQETGKAEKNESLLQSMSSSSNKNKGKLNLAIIGSGQSSAEMSLHLHQTFPNANIKLIFRSSALAPSDDSTFVNAAAFDPERTDIFWNGSIEDRNAWVEEYRRTNYSVVRRNVLEEIDKILYNQKLSEEFPLDQREAFISLGKYELVPNTQVIKAEVKENNRVTLHFTRTKNGIYKEAEIEEVFDAVFLGTGFLRRPTAMPFLQPLSDYFPLLDEESESKKVQLGFQNEEESRATIEALSTPNDSSALERLRQRTRGITRDYRLVSYLSDAFTLPREIIMDPKTTKSSEKNSPKMGNVESGQHSPGRLSHDSESTLASHQEETIIEEDGFQPCIYFVGGNELTHGLADSLFSIVAHRAGELINSIMKFHKKQILAKEARRTRLEGQTKTLLKGASRILCEKCPLHDEVGEEEDCRQGTPQVAS